MFITLACSKGASTYVVSDTDPKTVFLHQTMAEAEITALKEALHNRLIIIKRLYTELEEEREASASGADEALTMILRLQKEKAEEKMEACQYKKMAEAKMHHAEESLAMLEQVIHHKDIEIASLKHQVQDFNQILLSVGINNADITKLNDLWLSCSASLGRTRSCVQVRRQNSMPSITFSKLCSEIAINKGDGSLFPAMQSIWREISDIQDQLKEHQKQCVSEKFVTRESDSDVKQVQEVNTSVERLLQTQNVEQKAVSRTISANIEFQINMASGPQSLEEESKPCSWHSAGSSDMLSNSCAEADSIGNKMQYVSTKHVLDIPGSNNGCLLRKSSKKVLQDPLPEAKQLTGIPESMIEETAHCTFADDDFSNLSLKFSTLKKGNSINSRQNSVEPRFKSISFQTDLEQLKCQVQQLTDDIRIMKQDDLKKGKEQLELLRQIYEQLKPVKSQFKSLKSNNSLPLEEALFVSLTEVRVFNLIAYEFYYVGYAGILSRQAIINLLKINVYLK